MPIELTVQADDAGRRLDRILRKALPDMRLSLLHRLLRQNKVSVDGKHAAAGFRVRAGQRISIAGITGDRREGPRLPPASEARRPVPPASASGLDIIQEGCGLLVLNKPVGLAVHGRNSLDSRVQDYLTGRLRPSLSFRPGPLHRLDTGTSGIIVFSTSLEGARCFSALIREGKVRKRYLALVDGLIGGPELWEDSLVRDRDGRKTLVAASLAAEEAGGAKKARTAVRPLAVSETGYTLILAEIETGRTHQIRSQAASRGHPLAGDLKYGGSFQAGGFFLHAFSLDTDGNSPEMPLSVTAAPPERFLKKIAEIFDDECYFNFFHGIL
ncbi:MAG: RluA family pseudouridine synthase [Treponema sp.]|jgi:23S rRNA pseudouridine955/2504/2580 synthase|nr:RluA family pseudouridine synthase [Treponema sp.]